MADYEVSKLMWMAIVIALAASIFTIAKPEINTLAGGVFDKVEDVVKSIDTGDNNTHNDTNKPDPTDPKWVEQGNYGDNGYFVMDAEGNGIVYALDDSKPISLNNVPDQTKANAKLTTLTYLNQVIAPTNSLGFFIGNAELTKISGLENFDTSNVTNMDKMFYNNSKLNSLNVTAFDTSAVTSMNEMFSGDSALTSLDVSKFNTSNVTSMSGMFSGMMSITSIDVSNFDTSNVTNMEAMFVNTDALTSLDVSNFKTSKVTSFRRFLSSDNSRKSITSLNVSNLDVSNATDIRYMFKSNPSLTADMIKVDNVKAAPSDVTQDYFAYNNKSETVKKLTAAFIQAQ